MHRADCHPPAEAPAVQGGQAREVRPQAERVKRPTLALSGRQGQHNSTESGSQNLTEYRIDPKGSENDGNAYR